MRILVVAACLALAALPALGQEPSRIPATAAELAAQASEEWYGVYMQGKKCGYAHMAFKPTGTQADPTFTQTMRMEMRLVAMGQKQTLKMHEQEVFDGKAPFALRSAASSQTQGAKAQRVTARRKGEGFEVVLRSAGSERTLVRPAIDYNLLDAVLVQRWFETPRAAGATVTNRSLDLDRWALDAETLTIEKVEDKRLDGVQTKLYTVRVKSSRHGDMGRALCDARGNIIQMRLMGVIELRREPAKLAQKIEYSADLFVKSMLKVERKLGRPTGVQRLELKVTGEARKLIEPGSFQTVTHEADATRLVIDVAQGKPLPATPKEIRESLQETTDYPTGHPQVQALLEQALGDAKTPQQKVAKLVHFVSEYIKDEYGKDSVSVLEVIQSKTGDCTEHALLFTTLARAAKIPARTVGGVMYMGDEFQAFGGHAWSEVVLDGKWIPVDPTWDEARIDAAHIRTDAGEGSNGLRLLGKIKLEVVSVKRK